MNRRFRRILFWCTFAASISVVGVWVLSCFLWTYVWYGTSSCSISVLISHGRLICIVGTSPVPQHSRRFRLDCRSQRSIAKARQELGADMQTNNYGFIIPALDMSEFPARTTASIPGWVPLLVFGIPTILLWRRDRPRPGSCPGCGFDPTGNVSGTCPECGRASKDRTCDC